MSSVSAAKDLLTAFKFERVKGRPDVSIIRLKTHRHRATRNPVSKRDDMTEEELDKFERDIADAFEQVP